MISQMWPQEGTEEGLRKTKFIMLTGPRKETQGVRSRNTWKNSRVVRREKTGWRAKSNVEAFLRFAQ
jgi:hypothetical protein